MRTRAARFPGGCWPDAGQSELLRVCLQPEDAARAAWKRWRATVDFERTDGGSFRLLGLVFRRVSGWACDDPVLPRLKGIYRKGWVRTQMLLAGKPALIESLSREGIPTMLLKGAALIPTVYGDAGTRPMDDFDLFVPHKRAKHAMDLLLARGWKSEFLNREALVDSLHACHFRHPKEGNLDLHWHVMHADCRAGADSDFWNARVPLRWEGVDTFVLGPADQLLHTCEHGPRFNSVPPLRWLADAWKIIHAAGPVLDWDRFCRQAVHRQLTLPARLSLEWLENNIGPVVPPEVVNDLRRRHVTLFERLEYRLAQRPLPPDSTLVQRLPLNLCFYWRLKRRAGLRRFAGDLPNFLRHINNLERPLHQYLQDHARYLWRTRRPILWNRLRRLRAALPEEMESIHPHDTTGFHLLEAWNGRNFRWSRAEAIIRLRRDPGHVEVVLDFGGVRAWRDDLQKSLTVHFNTHAVTLRESSEHAVFFEVRPEMFEAAVYQRIILRCEPLKHAAAETRELGVPLFAVRLTPIASLAERAVLPEQMESIHPHRMTGFHLLEAWKGRRFRWSRAEAFIRLSREPGHIEIALDFGGVRAWRDDLQKSLTVHFNSHAVALRETSVHVVSFEVQPEMFEAGGYQCIMLRCDPLKHSTAETRELGVPLFAIRITPITSLAEAVVSSS
ncbi:MAG: nucleotidyltransferase family protein [Phycisphaeraceae bacterium]|nr:nucleotidyltransferase family protein [Phycisphaeraceae bacterium]